MTDAVRFDVRPFTLRFARPIRGVTTRQAFLVEAHRGGRIGRGEACIAPELGTETAEECARALRLSDGNLDGVPGFPPAARHAVEESLLELEALEAGVPVAQMLAKGAARTVECSALLSGDSMAELAREARRAVGEGFRTLKLKVGGGDDFARAAVVRDAAGPDVRLRLDANGAWGRDEALRRLHELASLDIELCEQPTPDLLHLEESPIPIAADELVVQDVDAALARASIAVLKPMALGGQRAALAVANRARAAGRDVIVTTSLDGAIARAGAAHLAAAVGSPYAAGLATGRLLAEDVCADWLAPRDGRIHLPAAGL